MTDEQWQSAFITLGVFWVLSKGTDLAIWLWPVFRGTWRDLWTLRANVRDEGHYRGWMLPIMLLECFLEQFCARWNGHELELLRNPKKETDE